MTETPQPKWTFRPNAGGPTWEILFDDRWMADARNQRTASSMCDALNASEEQRHATEPPRCDRCGGESSAPGEDGHLNLCRDPFHATDVARRRYPVTCLICDKCPMCHMTTDEMNRLDVGSPSNDHCPDPFHASTPPAHSEVEGLLHEIEETLREWDEPPNLGTVRVRKQFLVACAAALRSRYRQPEVERLRDEVVNAAREFVEQFSDQTNDEYTVAFDNLKNSLNALDSHRTKP